MSAEYTWKGTIAATAIVSAYPDTSGNFWCDGVADDVEIQAAITYLNGLDGGKIFWRAGTYTATSVIDFESNIQLTGEKGTVIYHENGGTLFRIAYDSNILIENLYITSSEASQGDAVTIYQASSTDITVRNLIIIDTGGGIRATDGSRIIVDNNIVKGAKDDDITFTGTVEDSIITNNICYGYHAEPELGASGIEVDDGVEKILIAGNLVIGTKAQGIAVHHHEDEPISKNVLVIGNIVSMVDGQGITVYGLDVMNENIVVRNNMIIGDTNTTYGIRFHWTKWGDVTGNFINGYGTNGIFIGNTEEAITRDNTVRGGVSGANAGISISTSYALRVWIDGNRIESGEDTYGITNEFSEYARITNNYVRDIGSACGIRNAGNYSTIENNLVRSASGHGIQNGGGSGYSSYRFNTLRDNDQWGMDIPSGTRNVVMYNLFINNGWGALDDDGTETILETITLYIASYNVTDVSESEDGLVIDGAGEWVSFVGQLPLHVQQVVRFEIWAVGLAAPGAGNQMCLTIEIEGGADDEPKTQHDTGPLAGQLNTTENTAVNDIIHWVCTHANALALLGGDSVKCACRYNAAVASDIATNAAFRRVLVHIV